MINKTLYLIRDGFVTHEDASDYDEKKNSDISVYALAYNADDALRCAAAYDNDLASLDNCEYCDKVIIAIDSDNVY